VNFGYWRGFISEQLRALFVKVVRFVLKLMAKPKGVLNKVESKPKTTSIGHSTLSRPARRGKKKYRGQGK
jgi:hypothetical protein